MEPPSMRADERHHDFLRGLGARCFLIDPDEWLPALRGKMDVVLDSVCLDGYESSRLALNPAGTLVCTPRGTGRCTRSGRRTWIWARGRRT